jgi:hypothetical protein
VRLEQVLHHLSLETGIECPNTDEILVHILILGNPVSWFLAGNTALILPQVRYLSEHEKQRTGRDQSGA